MSCPYERKIERRMMKSYLVPMIGNFHTDESITKIHGRTNLQAQLAQVPKFIPANLWKLSYNHPVLLSSVMTFAKIYLAGAVVILWP